MELIIRDQMLTYVLENGLLNQSQHGFLPGKSTVTQLLAFLDLLTATLDSGDSLDVVYLDFRKAFDSVSHAALLFKLQAYGFQGELLGWIATFLSGRSQQVRVGSSLSESSTVESGVPQGTIFDPLLFTLFVDDIDTRIQSRLFKYADDFKIAGLITRASPVLDSAILQVDLVLLEDWSKQWIFDFNAAKCFCVNYGRTNPQQNYILLVTKLPTAQTIKDIGVTFCHTVSFSTHWDYRSQCG